MRRAVVLLSGALIGACVPWRRAPVSAALDLVAEKRMPLTLVATSGRTCLTDLVTFTAVKPGQMFECAWSSSAKSKTVPIASPSSADSLGRSPPRSHDKFAGTPWWWPFRRPKR